MQTHAFYCFDSTLLQYLIQVDTGLPGLSWRVGRRYQMFVGLDKDVSSKRATQQCTQCRKPCILVQLKVLFDKLKLPAVPKKGIGRNFKPGALHCARAPS